jgi:malonate-semialdehyde dehydrogenase (acetylating)/methylmalonate-semialdehyde dehydrogenase
MFIQLLVALFIMFNCEQSHVGIFTHPYGKQVVQFYTQTKTVTARWFDDDSVNDGVNTTISLR